MATPEQEQADNACDRRAALVVVALLAAVLIANLIVRFDPVLLYGLLGGLAGCLVVIGLDRLRAMQRRAATPQLERESGERNAPR